MVTFVYDDFYIVRLSVVMPNVVAPLNMVYHPWNATKSTSKGFSLTNDSKT
jgi:hypothetical protein